jgi:3-isopropylmalate dehydrogenase
MSLKIVVLEGDETGQELLEQAVRVLDSELLELDLELETFDLSLEKRRSTGNEIVHEAARAMRSAGFGLKAATITPEGKDDVGSPNRILREEVDGKVIVRTGRRIPGVVGPVSGVYHPISVVRMAVEDAYGAKQWREGTEGAGDEIAYRTEKVTRSTAGPCPNMRSGRPRAWARGSTAGRSGRSRQSTRGCSRRRWTPRRHDIPRWSTSPS